LNHARLILGGLTVLGLIAVGESAAFPGPSREAPDAPIYRYTDPQGNTVFTNDLSKIPSELRSSAQAVELPPAVTMSEPPPPPPPPLTTRLRDWFDKRPTGYRLILIGVLPPLILSLWVLNYFRKRSDSLFLKMSMRLGMIGIVILSAYLCYFIFVRFEASRLSVTVPDEGNGTFSPRQKAEELKKDEADRLKTIENLADPQ